MLYLGTYAGLQDGGVNTLQNLRVELGAARHLLTGSPTDYFHGDGDLWWTFLQRQLAGLDRTRTMPAALGAFPKLGVLASRWQAAEEATAPEAPALRRELLGAVPQSLLLDAAADWSWWPGRPLF